MKYQGTLMIKVFEILLIRRKFNRIVTCEQEKILLKQTLKPHVTYWPVFINSHSL